MKINLFDDEQIELDNLSIEEQRELAKVIAVTAKFSRKEEDGDKTYEELINIQLNVEKERLKEALNDKETEPIREKYIDFCIKIYELNIEIEKRKIELAKSFLN